MFHLGAFPPNSLRAAFSPPALSLCATLGVHVTEQGSLELYM
jgi:hypothetical protein